MQSPETATDEIIKHLSRLILSSLRQYELEAINPSQNADRMDDRLKFFRERASKLAAIRSEVELEMSKATP